MRTLQPAPVEVFVTVDGAERSFGPVPSTAETDLTAVVPVTGLKPGTRYAYRVLVDGKAIALPSTAAITTAPRGDGPSQVRIAFGSCYHRWGIGNTKQADLIRRRGPAAFLAIGDIAVQDRNNHAGLARADYLQREFEPASLGGRSGAPIPNVPEKLFGIQGKYAFGEFTVDATVADPTVEFRLIGENENIIYEIKLTRSQLTPPAENAGTQ